METKALQLGDQTIMTYHSAGDGPAALLVHGNSASGRTFQPQLDGPLGQKFRLVALDLPGHGQSSPATDPKATYNMPGYAKIILEVAQQLNLTNAVLVGWSLGGHAVLETAPHLPQAAGFVIYGTPPIGIPPAMGEAFQANPSMASIFNPEIGEEELQAWGAACLKPGSAVAPEFFEDVRRTDKNARAFLGGSLGEVNYTDEIEIVRQLKAPIAILHGEDEQLVNEGYISQLNIPTLWRGAVQIVKGSGHTIHQEQSDSFNALLEAFLLETAR